MTRIYAMRFLCVLSLWCVLTTLTQADEQYVVRPGDTLSRIAQTFYGDPMKWTLIYRKNKRLIRNVDRLKIGWRLKIPSQPKSDTTTSQQEASKSVSAPQADTPIVRLVTGDAYPPFTDRKLYRDGMITDLVIRILKEMGYHKRDIEIEWWSWKHGFDATKQGEFLATFPYLKNEERKKDFYYTASLYDVLGRWFVKKDSGIAQDMSAQNFNELKTCKPEGYYQHDIKELVSQGKLQLIMTKTIEACFEKLDKGEIDIISASEFVGQGILATLTDNGQLNKDDFFMLDEPVTSSGLHIIASKNNPKGCKFVYEFNEALERLEKKGKVDRVRKRHIEIYKEEVGF